MLSNILQTIICYEFDSNIGRRQWKQHFDGDPMYGMQINFKLHELDYEAPPLYPGVQLLIFAPSNHVGVYYRESLTRDEYGPWQHLSKHDSCWRTDGVDRFISRYRERIATLGWHDGICNDRWYSKVEISEHFAKELDDITKTARGL